MNKEAIVIGAGIAGVEAASQIASMGIKVKLYEMRPSTPTPAHTTEFFGELVCSNSLGSELTTSANGLLKKELEILNSFYLKNAQRFKVPAGKSLAVDRIKLGSQITKEIKEHKNVEVINQEVTDLIDFNGPVILASGPLTSPKLSHYLTTLTMRKNLFFFDATCPILKADSIDHNFCFWASRYDKGDPDFINIPLDEAQYTQLVNNLISAEKVKIKDFEKDLFFEACLPIEEIASRGALALAFGPLKPVGLIHPKTGKRPHAVIQLRHDDLKKNFLQMVGFQTRLKWGEQKRIFQKIPGLKKVNFERYGRMHKNTYINAPLILNEFLQFKGREDILFSGQLCGVEGYVESIATGLFAGLVVSNIIKKQLIPAIPKESALGSLIHYITHSDWKNFKPTKFTFGLLPSIKKTGISKKQKKELKAHRAIESIKRWKESINI